jgi:hypothetical protein
MLPKVSVFGLCLSRLEKVETKIFQHKVGWASLIRRIGVGLPEVTGVFLVKRVCICLSKNDLENVFVTELMGMLVSGCL